MQFKTAPSSLLILAAAFSSTAQAGWGLTFYADNTCSGSSPAAFGDDVAGDMWSCYNIDSSVLLPSVDSTNSPECGGFGIMVYTEENCKGDSAYMSGLCAWWRENVDGSYEETWKSFEVQAINC